MTEAITPGHPLYDILRRTWEVQKGGDVAHNGVTYAEFNSGERFVPKQPATFESMYGANSINHLNSVKVQENPAPVQKARRSKK